MQFVKGGLVASVLYASSMKTDILEKLLKKTISFGTEYNSMTEAQQYELGSYVNLMSASTQLLVNPIMGLKPNYTESDLERYMKQ